ncbi:hypothetical protein EIP86_005479 [Pleurotus ostreatoroseus]|nr:hypothetical protein EIP86_005479 [Pleurotus ostreatoroseus]
MLMTHVTQYETNSEDVRHLFEEHGEIKTFFDLISNRGMVFVTYYDIRAAERARERLQGSEISGRPQLQGTLLVTLRNSVSGQPIDDNEVRRKFQQFGDVREIRMVNERPDQRYVEFFDTRACEEAHDRLRHQGLQDGVMEIVFASDSENPRGQSPRRGGDRGNFDRGGREWDDFPQRGRRGGRGGRGRGRGGNWGGEDFDRRGDWGGRDRERGRPFEDEFGRMGRNGSWNDRFDNRGFGGPTPGPGGPPGPPGPLGPGMMPPPYGGPPPPPPNYGPPPPTAGPTTDERLEQAKKVQQLLAALKPTQTTAAPPTNQPAPSAQMPSIPPSQPPSSYYGAPPMPPYPGGPPAAYPPPPTMPASAPISQSPATGNTNGASIATLPPNILALLQQTAQSHPQQPTPPPAMPQNAYSMPPVQAPLPPVPGVSSMPPPGQFQNLMSYLQVSFGAASSWLDLNSLRLQQQKRP